MSVAEELDKLIQTMNETLEVTDRVHAHVAGGWITKLKKVRDGVTSDVKGKGSTPLQLSAKDRDTFATYLETSAKSGSAMVEQMEGLGGIHEAMIRKIKLEALAERTVAAKLRATQDMSM